MPPTWTGWCSLRPSQGQDMKETKQQTAQRPHGVLIFNFPLADTKGPRVDKVVQGWTGWSKGGQVLLISLMLIYQTSFRNHLNDLQALRSQQHT